MVKLRFVVRTETLVLRISEGKERFYRSVMSILIGNPNLQKHWSAEKERFLSSAVSYKENNAALMSFKKTYQDLVFEHPEYTAKQIVMYYDAPTPSRMGASSLLVKQTPEAVEYQDNVLKFLEKVIERERAKPGCNFEIYLKILRKCKKVVPNFERLQFKDINYDKCVELALIFAQYNGYANTVKQFRNLLGKASKDQEVHFHISQIGDFSFRDYNPHQDHIFDRKPDVLSPEQVRTFLNMDPLSITPQYKDRNTVRLYYDFCVFMLHSFLSPCDVIKLKQNELTNGGMIMARRKKTHCVVRIPVSPIMDRIIVRYANFSKDGYVFPIMDDDRVGCYKTKDYLFKKFGQYLNVWLKDLGKELGTKFKLYAYVFRHTAITMALDNGLSISYVATVAGTSVEMIQKHYYNGDNIKNSQKLQTIFMNAASN